MTDFAATIKFLKKLGFSNDSHRDDGPFNKGFCCYDNRIQVHPGQSHDDIYSIEFKFEDSEVFDDLHVVVVAAEIIE